MVSLPPPYIDGNMLSPALSLARLRRATTVNPSRPALPVELLNSGDRAPSPRGIIFRGSLGSGIRLEPLDLDEGPAGAGRRAADTRKARDDEGGVGRNARRLKRDVAGEV